MSMEFLVRPFQNLRTILPEPAKSDTPIPGSDSDAFILWGGPSTFEQLPPIEDMTADDQCSTGVGYTQMILEPAMDAITGTVPNFAVQSGPATSGTRAEAEPANPTAQTITQYWTQNSYTVTGSGDYWVQEPKTRTVTYYATEIEALQARENLNIQKRTFRNDPAQSQTITLLRKKPPKKKPQDNKPGIVSYDEIDRYEEAYTIYKPGDNSIYVNVTRCLSIRFRGPKGEIHKFNYKPPPPPKRPDGPNPPKGTPTPADGSGTGGTGGTGG